MCERWINVERVTNGSDEAEQVDIDTAVKRYFDSVKLFFNLQAEDHYDIEEKREGLAEILADIEGNCCVRIEQVINGRTDYQF